MAFHVGDFPKRPRAGGTAVWSSVAGSLASVCGRRGNVSGIVSLFSVMSLVTSRVATSSKGRRTALYVVYHSSRRSMNSRRVSSSSSCSSCERPSFV